MTSRRNFILTAGAALAQSAVPARAANDRIRVACIGFGIMGQGDVRTAVTVPGVELAAVSDVYQGRLTLAKERYGNNIFTTRDYREVIARPDVDAVIVATPDHWHDRIAIDAMNAGKDVYCQKPMVQKVEYGAGVIEAQNRTGRILQVGSQRVSSVLYQKAKELIREGAVGEVHMVEAWWDRSTSLGAWQYSIPPDASEETIDWDRFLGRAPKRSFEPIRLFRWRNYRDYGTGIAGDLFVHQFSGIHFVMDSIGPTRVCAMGGTHYWKDGRDVPDLMMGMYQYPQTSTHPAFELSLRVNFEAGAAEQSGFRFIGTDGVLNLSVGNAITVSKKPKEINPGTTAETFSKAIEEKILAENRAKYPPATVNADSLRASTEQRFAMPHGYTEQYAHHLNFFEHVRSRKPVIEDAVFGLRAAGPALLSNLSLFENRQYIWDPEKMVIRSA
ncbi:MAG: Gfo/Idh/MocA family oxidoreductase [Acidobacteriaceae bacterium]|nr:Gfo/Idh/MocA family oxidoreductase [Acidobacteriaceae bacterium]